MAAIYQLPTDQTLSSATLTNPTNGSASGYALTDLYNGNPAFGWHASAASTFYILLDFGAVLGRAVKLIGFHNHNFDAGVVLTIQGNATNSWGAPTVNSTVTVPAARADGRGTDFYWLNAAQSSSLRYWRIGTTTTNSAAWILGQMWVSATVRNLPVRNVQDSTMVITDHTVTIEHLTPAGVSLRYEQTNGQVLIGGDVTAVLAGFDTVRDWHRSCRGRSRPTMFVPFDDVNECAFVIHDQDDLPKMSDGADLWKTTLRLRSLSPGPGWS